MGRKSVNIRVVIRFRPINSIERASHHREDEMAVEFSNKNRTVRLWTKDQMVDKSWNFDFVFDWESDQDTFYKVCAAPVMNDVLSGFYGTIFAYGQTGSGKTWSMMGPTDTDLKKDHDLRGLIPRCASAVFDHIGASTESNVVYRIMVSYLEIYNDEIQCLLDTTKKRLAIHESPSRGIYVHDLTETYVTRIEQVFYYIALGDHNKMMAETGMNKLSSRSHSVLTITIQKTDTLTGSTTTGKVNLVDLAGSEKVRKTRATGIRMQEAQNINKSLSALGFCINSIVEKKPHIPYRNSKLTRMLQESLGGNSKTTVVCTCSPHRYNLDETISTLEFGKRAKSIKLRVKANIMRSAEELQKMVESLQRQIRREKIRRKRLLEELARLRDLTEDEMRQLGSLTQQTTGGAGDSVDEPDGTDSSPSSVNSTSDSDSDQMDMDGYSSSDETKSVSELRAEMRELRARYEAETMGVNSRLEVAHQARLDAEGLLGQQRQRMTTIQVQNDQLLELREQFVRRKADLEEHLAFRVRQGEAKCQTYQTEHEQLLQRISDLTARKETLNDSLSSAKGTKQQTAQAKESFQTQVERYSESSNRLREQNEALLDKVELMEMTTESARKEIIENESDFNVISKMKDALISEEKKLLARFTEFKSDLDETEAELEELCTDNERFETQNEVLVRVTTALSKNTSEKNSLLKKMKNIFERHSVDVMEMRAIVLDEDEVRGGNLEVGGNLNQETSIEGEMNGGVDGIITGDDEIRRIEQMSRLTPTELSSVASDNAPHPSPGVSNVSKPAPAMGTPAAPLVIPPTLSVTRGGVVNEELTSLSIASPVIVSFCAAHCNADVLKQLTESSTELSFERPVAVDALLHCADASDIDTARQWISEGNDGLFTSGGRTFPDEIAAEGPHVTLKTSVIRHVEVSSECANWAVEGAVARSDLTALIERHSDESVEGSLGPVSRVAALKALLMTGNRGVVPAREWLREQEASNPSKLKEPLSVSVKTIRQRIGGQIGALIASRRCNSAFLKELTKTHGFDLASSIRALIDTRNVSLEAAEEWIEKKRSQLAEMGEIVAAVTMTEVRPSGYDADDSVSGCSVLMSGVDVPGTECADLTHTFIGRLTDTEEDVIPELCLRPIGVSHLCAPGAFSTVTPLLDQTLVAASHHGRAARKKRRKPRVEVRIEKTTKHLSESEIAEYQAIISQLTADIDGSLIECGASERKLGTATSEREAALSELRAEAAELLEKRDVSAEKLRLLEERGSTFRQQLKAAKAKYELRVAELEEEKKKCLLDRERFLQRAVSIDSNRRGRGGRGGSGSRGRPRGGRIAALAARFGGTAPSPGGSGTQSIRRIADDLYELRMKYSRAESERARLLRECNNQRRQMTSGRRNLRATRTNVQKQDEELRALEHELDDARTRSSRRQDERSDFGRSEARLLKRIAELEQKLTEREMATRKDRRRRRAEAEAGTAMGSGSGRKLRGGILMGGGLVGGTGGIVGGGSTSPRIPWGNVRM